MWECPNTTMSLVGTHRRSRAARPARRPAVVDDGNPASRNVDAEALGEVELMVVVALDREHVRNASRQSVQHGSVGDVAGVHDDVGDCKVGADPVQQPASLARPEVGIGEEQHVGSSHRLISTRIRPATTWESFLSSPSRMRSSPYSNSSP